MVPKAEGHLKEWDFEINPYDQCTFNKVIDGAQCTILYHVDDLKISHQDLFVLRKVAVFINNTFETRNQSLYVTEGKVHDYLGISINYNRKIA